MHTNSNNNNLNNSIGDIIMTFVEFIVIGNIILTIPPVTQFFTALGVL